MQGEETKEIKGRKAMSIIMVSPAEDGKYKVMVNYIQYGCTYSCRAQAEKEANSIRKLYGQVKSA